jgi:hypothetical protein
MKAFFLGSSFGKILVQLSGAVVAGGAVCTLVHFGLVGADQSIQSTLAVMSGGLTAGFAVSAIKRWQKRRQDHLGNDPTE